MDFFRAPKGWKDDFSTDMTSTNGGKRRTAPRKLDRPVLYQPRSRVGPKPNMATASFRGGNVTGPEHFADSQFLRYLIHSPNLIFSYDFFSLRICLSESPNPLTIVNIPLDDDKSNNNPTRFGLRSHFFSFSSPNLSQAVILSRINERLTSTKWGEPRKEKWKRILYHYWLLSIWSPTAMEREEMGKRSQKTLNKSGGNGWFMTNW